MSTPTVSEAKRAANARNGRLGGPRTPEGKARSRMNGLRHGMRAELVILPGESQEAFDHRLVAWTGELHAVGSIERHLAGIAVASSWRHERCLRNEAATLTERVLKADDPDPEVVQARVRRLGARLAKDPADVTYRLRKTSAGCLWLLARWDDLDAALDRDGTWEQSRVHQAIHLLGFAPAQWRDEAAVAAVLIAALSARHGAQTIAAHVRQAVGLVPQAMNTIEFEGATKALAAAAEGIAEGRRQAQGDRRGGAGRPPGAAGVVGGGRGASPRDGGRPGGVRRQRRGPEAAAVRGDAPARPAVGPARPAGRAGEASGRGRRGGPGRPSGLRGMRRGG